MEPKELSLVGLLWGLKKHRNGFVLMAGCSYSSRVLCLPFVAVKMRERWRKMEPEKK